MKKILNNIFFYTLIAFLFTSCRTEEIEFIKIDDDDILIPNSSIANLMLKTSSNDGSFDNIIDQSNCFNIKLPITTTVNSKKIIINTKADYKIVEYIFDESDDDDDILIITFPIIIILSDFSEIKINDYTELTNYSKKCNGENEFDEDIECLDFEYPITASYYNAKKEITNTISINYDKDLHHFISNLDENDFISINFPIKVTLFDKTKKTINSFTELKEVIETHNNDCDEDDDCDYNDDDCIDCNTEKLIKILTDCDGWTVDTLKRNGNDYTTLYDGYIFNFFEDGTLIVYWNSISTTGTWIAEGEGQNMVVIINVPKLPYCNNNWDLKEISKYSETKIDLRVGDGDRMRYTNICN